MREKISPLAVALIIGALAYSCTLTMLGLDIVRHTRRFHHHINALESYGERLSRTATDITTTSQAIRRKMEEIRFLQGVVQLIPEQKGYQRTQQAVSDEVAALRRKLSRRLGNELHVVVDTRASKLYVKRGLTLLWQADCSAGRGGVLVDKKTGRRWEFVTPRGKFEILGKWANPTWTKPDWAFIESGEEVPPPDDPRRKVQGELGGFVLNLGDGYLIHGTKTEALLGRPVSHGCVRLGALDLQRLYDEVPTRTRVYIY